MNRVTQLTFTDTQMAPMSSTITVTPNCNMAKRCMFCTLDISDTHVGCPVKHVEKHNNLKYTDREHVHEYVTYGIFCSYNCALAFALDKSTSDDQFAHSVRYISMILKKETGELVKVIPSPPKELMLMYGGYMTEDQYRLEIGKILYVSNGTTITHPISLVYNREV